MLQRLSLATSYSIIYVAFLSTSFAQNPEWINYTNGDNVKAVIEDGDYIWAGTNGGLVKIDQSSGETAFYNKANSGLPSNDVWSIAIDGSGNKWIGTGGGLASFDGTNWTVYYTSNSGLPDNEVWSIAIDGSGNKWIGTNGGGLAFFDGTNWSVYNTPNSGLPDNSVRSIAIDGSGNKWIGTYGGLASFDGTNWTVYKTSNSGLPNNWVRSIAIDGSGNKWIGTYGGLALFDGTNWTVYNTSNSGLVNTVVWSIAIDGSGNKWIGTFGGGLAFFDGTNWTGYNTSNSGLPSNDVGSIALDGSGNKWIGTNGGGLAFFDGTNWTVYNTSNSGLPDNRVRPVAIDDSGNKWIGTGYGLAFFDGTNWTGYNTSNSGLPDNWVYSIAIDGSENKWIGTDNGLASFDGTNWTVYYTSNSGLPLNQVNSIAIDSSGNKWIGTYGGLASFDGTNWMVYDVSNSGLPYNWVSSIAIDGSGNKWIGTYGGGLAFFDGTNWMVYNTSNSGLPDDGVSSIAIDGSGNKWISTYDGGLASFDGTNWMVYDVSNSGLTHNRVYSIAIDGSGNKWIGTRNGLAVYIGGWVDPQPPANLYQAYAPHNTESTGPFALMFRIWENENMEFTYQSGYIHYGIGTIDQYSELIQTTYNDSAAYLGLIPRFDEVTGTTELSYYISANFEGGTTLYWPPEAPDIPATMIFGPDTTAPVVSQVSELTDVHYLLPFSKTVHARIIDDRFEVGGRVNWRVGNGVVQSNSMHFFIPFPPPGPPADFFSMISDVVGTAQDTVSYWVTAVDSSQNQNSNTSDIYWFVGQDFEVIGDWENNTYYPWTLWGTFDSSTALPEWGEYLLLDELPTGISDTMMYHRVLDLRLFEEVWLTIPMWYDLDPTGNTGYFETSLDSETWILDRLFTGTFGPLNVDISLIPYIGEDSLFIRFRVDRNTEGAFLWAIDDIILHSDSSRLTINEEELIPKKFTLHQNYPNPFNPITTIRFDLPEAGEVELVIYDILGREVEELVSGRVVSGVHEVVWNASNVASGVYFYRLVVRRILWVRQNGILSYVETKKLVVLK